MPVKQRLRAWASFNLKFVFGVVFLVSIGLALPMWSVRRAQLRREVHERLRTKNVIISYEHLHRRGGGSRNRTPPGPRFVAQFFGDENLFARAKSLTMLSSAKLVDADLENFRLLTKVQMLSLPHGITDDGIAHIAGMRNLNSLSVRGGAQGITSEGAEHLSRLTNLEYLYLYGTSLTDEGVLHLVRLARLKELALPGAEITDKSIDLISTLKDLQE